MRGIKEIPMLRGLSLAQVFDLNSVDAPFPSFKVLNIS